MTDYHKKYLKYKQKYLELKIQIGGKIKEIRVSKKEDHDSEKNMYVTSLDKNKFLKFSLKELNKDDIIEYSEYTQDADKIKTFIRKNFDKKYVYLSDFYMLSKEEHEKIYKNIKSKKEEIEAIQGSRKLTQDELEKLKNDVDVELFAGSEIMTKDIRGLGKQILFFVLKKLYGNEIVLCLEPVLGSDPLAVHFANIDKTEEQRYADLIKYYQNKIYSPDNVDNLEVEAKGTFSQYKMYANLKMLVVLKESNEYNRKFMMGKINLDKHIKEDKDIYDKIVLK